MGVYNTKPTLEMPTRTDQFGNEIEFRYVASEDILLNLFTSQKYDISQAIQQLELIIESYRPDRDKILKEIRD